jgi:hypothetical protein
MNTTGKEMPRIRDVRPGRNPYTLRVFWRGGGMNTIDMTGVVNRIRAFEPLQDTTVFRDVKVIDHGWAIGWGDGLELDYPADALERLAEEQTEMTCEDFNSWQDSLALSIRETADLLGLSERTIKNYRACTHHIPVAVQIACRVMARDRTTLMAHYRPRKAGRPRKIA